MSISRRKFLKISAGAGAVLGMNLFSNPLLKQAFADSLKETPVIWLSAGCCSGCSVSLLNSMQPNIEDVILDQVLPGHHVELAWHPTVMAASGDLAMNHMYATEEKPFILVVEGSMLTTDDGRWCEVGEENGHGIPATHHVMRMAQKAKAVIAVGSCAAFGGVNSANMNPSGAKGVIDFMRANGISTPAVNLPGCAVHPDWFVGTLAAVLLGGPESVEVDELNRPKMFYSKLIHDNCPLRGQFDKGVFAQKFGDEGCLYKLGCKGPVAKANCPEKQFNGGTNWCIKNGHPCQGCVEPEYPYADTMWGTVPVAGITPPASYPPIVTPRKSGIDVTPGYTALAGAIAGAVATKALSKKSEGDKHDGGEE